VLLKHEISTLTKQNASEIVLQKIVQENKFPEIIGEKAKLKIKTICIKNSAEPIKSERNCSRTDDIYVLHFLWLKKELSFLRGVLFHEPQCQQVQTDIKI
jgi:hypothetical protein